MAKSQLVDLDFGSIARILNLLDPTLPQHPATKAYVDSAVEGLSWKDSVRVAAPVNVNLAAPGATIDGVTMVANDRFLAGNQTAGAENGIYIYNGASTPATRALDMSTAAEVEQAVVSVEEGTSANASFRQTQVNVTLGTTPLVFSNFATASPAATETTQGIAEIATQAEVDAGTDDQRIVTPLKLKNSKLFNQTKVFTIGDGTATSFNCDHNLNTRNVIITVFRNSGNFEDVEVDKLRPTVNRVTIATAPTVPSANGLVVVIQGTAA